MVRPFTRNSEYRSMWIFVMFDLPVGTKLQRGEATRFRNSLLKLGFTMAQFSVYVRHAWSREKAERIGEDVGRLTPPSGFVQVLYFTDKQYGMTKNFIGKRRTENPKEKPEQLLLF